MEALQHESAGIIAFLSSVNLQSTFSLEKVLVVLVLAICFCIFLFVQSTTYAKKLAETKEALQKLKSEKESEKHTFEFRLGDLLSDYAQLLAQLENCQANPKESSSDGSEQLEKMKNRVAELEAQLSANKSESLVAEQGSPSHSAAPASPHVPHSPMLAGSFLTARTGSEGAEGQSDENTQLKARIVELENRLAEVHAQADIRDLEMEDKMKAEMQALSAQLDAFQSQHTFKVQEYEAALAKEVSEKQAIQKSFDDFRAKEFSALQTEKMDLQTKLTGVKTQLSHVWEESQEKDQRIADLQKVYGHMEEITKSLQTFRKIAEESEEEKQRIQTDARSKIDALEKKVQTLQETKSELKVRIETQERALEEATLQLVKKVRECETGSTEAEELRRRLASANELLRQRVGMESPGQNKGQ